MRREHVSILILSLLMVLSTGCVPKQPELSRNKVLKQYDEVGTLDAELRSAKQDDVDIFAPDGYAKATALFEDSLALATEDRRAEAIAQADLGLGSIKKAESDAEKAKDIMREVIAHRDLAVEAKAPELYHDDFEEIDNELKEANRLIEAGDRHKAREYQKDLLSAYDDIQIQALEKGLMELARSSAVRARQNDAEDYAPKTMAEADKELELAVSIVQTDRSNLDLANEHAKNADYAYGKAYRITEIIKKSERRGLMEEDWIREFWKQLEEINSPTGTTLDLTVRSHLLTTSIRKRVEALQDSLKDSNVLIGKLEDRITKLQADHKAEVQKLESSTKKQLTALQRQQADAARHQREFKEKQTFISSLFTAGEATVYRKGENILISANGFYFRVGKAEIETVNFGLLNKILSSIKQFPGSVIRISGHTDSTGSDKANLMLSRKRAQNVAKSLINIGKIDPKRVAFAGYGESKPVASNETAVGRAKNRRIDLLIMNK